MDIEHYLNLLFCWGGEGILILILRSEAFKFMAHRQRVQKLAQRGLENARGAWCALSGGGGGSGGRGGGTGARVSGGGGEFLGGSASKTSA